MGMKSNPHVDILSRSKKIKLDGKENFVLFRVRGIYTKHMFLVVSNYTI